MTAIASAGGADSLWSAVDPESIELRFLDDEAAVYAASSDSTHLLSAAAGVALQALITRGAPASLDQLLQAMGDGLTADANRSERTGLAELLAALERIGLVASHAP